MRSLGMVAAVALCALGISTAAQADEIIEVYADSTIAGESGFLLSITQPDGNGQTIFVFDDGGLIRLFASRSHGEQSWEIEPVQQYICPAMSMDIDDSWPFVINEDGSETEARVVSLDEVTTASGSFSAYRADINRKNEPGTVIETMWFAFDAGFVRNQGYDKGVMEWRDDVTRHVIVGGTGYLPLAVGNRWEITEVAVPAGAASWGGMKSQYRGP